MELNDHTSITHLWCVFVTQLEPNISQWDKFSEFELKKMFLSYRTCLWYSCFSYKFTHFVCFRNVWLMRQVSWPAYTHMCLILEISGISLLKCYSQIWCGGSAENFKILVILYWFGGKTIKNKKFMKQSCKNQGFIFILAETPLVWIVIASDNIFNIEVNGAFAIHMIVHNLLLNAKSE